MLSGLCASPRTYLGCGPEVGVSDVIERVSDVEAADIFCDRDSTRPFEIKVGYFATLAYRNIASLGDFEKQGTFETDNAYSDPLCRRLTSTPLDSRLRRIWSEDTHLLYKFKHEVKVFEINPLFHSQNLDRGQRKLIRTEFKLEARSSSTALERWVYD